MFRYISLQLVLYAFIPLLLLFGACNTAGISVDQNSKKFQKLIWSDEFDYEGLPDPTKWSYDLGDACDLPAGCGWGNNELQYYTQESLKNARVENGLLTIELHKEKVENRNYSSARLVSKGKGDWKYGKIEVRAKLPRGKGSWGAIWMLSSENKYKGWPHSGEIDIMENVGYDPDTIHASAHTLAYHHSIGTHKSGKVSLPDAGEKFHIYSLEWEEDEYRVYADEKMIFRFEKEANDFKVWPFDQKFHLIMNIAYGGNWGGKMGLDDMALPANMQIDYVRVYAL
ncbi:MAG: glycoside hydrolase family 16 protein [Bacteroidia bacterium]|nr:glycoside hydrolase family 16 protein [Bacteroidia bacterium]